ncbi:MAG TPA: hypothetical protein VGQ38_02965 [Gaiellaceae bacterium]|jgi:hypothetical protein|nr:hypothetical protein [Gaiellaceae bacterium]
MIVARLMADRALKRLAERSDDLSVKPERFAERIEDVLTEREPRRALRVLTELQLDAVHLAPDNRVPGLKAGHRGI